MELTKSIPKETTKITMETYKQSKECEKNINKDDENINRPWKILNWKFHVKGWKSIPIIPAFAGVFLFIIIIFSFRYETDHYKNRIIRYDRFTSRVECKSVFDYTDDNWLSLSAKSLPEAKAIFDFEDRSEQLRDNMQRAGEEYRRMMDDIRQRREDRLEQARDNVPRAGEEYRRTMDDIRQRREERRQQDEIDRLRQELEGIKQR